MRCSVLRRRHQEVKRRLCRSLLCILYQLWMASGTDVEVSRATDADMMRDGTACKIMVAHAVQLGKGCIDTRACGR